ncbi:hypothetical protein [Pedobacter deserti]|uniref:hypothetical protein n=1 Tax=Pedobacter deserti TaxID=2817382 RepID=UPI0021087F00|nr:hypothetical protein [Pedobacter sp. SYSU D00382]
MSPTDIALASEKAEGESKRKTENDSNDDRLFDVMKQATIEAAANGFDESELQAMLKNA